VQKIDALGWKGANRNAAKAIMCVRNEHARGKTLMNHYSNEPAGWRPANWLKAAGHPFSLPILSGEIKAGRLDARKLGGGKNTVILTSPLEYYSKLPRTLDPSPNPRAREKSAA
jgi:hypothetical protein